jgi:hypothetical protein
LENPEMMQKIMAMAQSLGASQPTQQQTQEPPPASPFPDIDISMVQKLSQMAGKANIDSNQRSLLAALSPYLKGDRIGRLERAMRAAKLAGLASGFLSGQGGLFQSGR